MLSIFWCMVFRRQTNTFIGNFYLKLYLKNINMLLWFSCRVQLFASPWSAAHQASLSLTISRNLPKFMSIESVMLSSLLILCCPLFLLPSIVISIRETCNKANENVSLWILKSVRVIYTYRSTNKSKKRN